MQRGSRRRGAGLLFLGLVLATVPAAPAAVSADVLPNAGVPASEAPPVDHARTAARRTRLAAEQIRAVEAIYFAAMLEEMQAFRVADRLVEQFQAGLLPIGRGNAGRSLEAFWRNRAARIAEPARRRLYATTLGLRGGGGSGSPRREFETLFLGFVSSVSSYARQRDLDDALGVHKRPAKGAEQVRAAARDLARNVSMHGGGATMLAAAALEEQTKATVALLSQPEIMSAYGARSWYEVVDKVAAQEFGAAPNVVRYRTMGAAGATILEWLADNADRLTRPSFALKWDGRRRAGPIPPIRKRNPTDADLVRACEQWLAVMGTQ